MTKFAAVPMQDIGPIRITGPEVNDEVMVPLATYETPLWPSTARGARLSMLCAGIHAVVTKEQMTRSILVEAASASDCQIVALALQSRFSELQEIVTTRSRFAQLENVHSEIVGNLLYIRLAFLTGDASGHNMVTQAADDIMAWLLQQYQNLRYVSVSGNYCTDKKTSAINGILGRGKHVVAELVVPRKLCRRYLKAYPEKIVELNIKKNLIGSTLAGSLRSANAHFANMLLGFYIATGQDAANIIEGSQGIVHTQLQGDDLYFSVTLPNLIVGSVGNGKGLPFVQENLRQLGCLDTRPAGQNGRRLAIIAAATVLCGELSLLGALNNQGELMDCHRHFERDKDLLKPA